jgi:uncharacterized protein HemY
MRKKLLAALILIGGSFPALACSVCEKQQPKILQGVTHGTGPQSQWDLLIISIVAAIVVFTLYFSVKWLIRPGETSPGHIKRAILKNE